MQAPPSSFVHQHSIQALHAPSSGLRVVARQPLSLPVPKRSARAASLDCNEDARPRTLCGLGEAGSWRHWVTTPPRRPTLSQWAKKNFAKCALDGSVLRVYSCNLPLRGETVWTLTSQIKRIDHSTTDRDGQRLNWMRPKTAFLTHGHATYTISASQRCRPAIRPGLVAEQARN